MIVGVGTDGKVDIFNSTLTDTDVLVDSSAGSPPALPRLVGRRTCRLRFLSVSAAPRLAALPGPERRPRRAHGRCCRNSQPFQCDQGPAVVTDVHTVNSTGASYLTAYPSAAARHQ